MYRNKGLLEEIASLNPDDIGLLHIYRIGEKYIEYGCSKIRYGKDAIYSWISQDTILSSCQRSFYITQRVKLDSAGAEN
jgi:hypothetical protein